MIYSKRTEKNLVNSTDAVINKKIDYTDTLTFRVPVNEDILVEDVLLVKSRIINQQYRVHEITAKGMFKEIFCKHVFFDIEKVVIDSLPIRNEIDIEEFTRQLNLKLKEKRLDFKVDVDTLKRSKELSQGAYSISDGDYRRTLEWVTNVFNLNSDSLSTTVDEYLRETNQSGDNKLKTDILLSFNHLLSLYARSYCYLRNLEDTNLVNLSDLHIPVEEIQKRETMYKSSNLLGVITPIVGMFTYQNKDLIQSLSETTVRINYVENLIDRYRKRKSNINVNDTNLYNLIFSDKGILKSFNYKVVWDNYNIKFVNSVVGNNTEILFHEKKNISDMQNSSSSKPLVTRLYVTCKYKEDKNSEDYKQKQAEKRRTNYDNKTNEIEERYRQEDAERERKRAISDASRNTPTTRRTKEQINQDIIEKRRLEDAERERKRQLAREKRASTFNAREEIIRNKDVNKQAEDEARTFKVTVESPLINFYSRVYEDTISFESSEIQSVGQLEEYCKHHFFNEEDTRDVPISKFSFQPVQEELRISLYDYARVVFNSLERVNKVVQCIEIKYDPMNDKYINVEFGDATVSPRYNQLSKITENIKSYVNDKYNSIDGVVSEIESNFNLLLEKEHEAFDLMFDDKKLEFELEIENSIKEAELKVIEQNGVLEQQLKSKIEEEATKNQELIDEFKQSFDATKHDLLIRINEGSPDVSALRNEFNSEISELRTEATRLTNEVREEANNLVNNIKVGSRNYILNSGTITGNNWYTRGANWQLQNDVYLNLPIFSWVGGSYKETPIANVTVKTGETYTFSSWVKRDSPGRLYLYLYDTTFNNDARLDIRRDHTFENNAEWQFIKITFTATRDGLIKIRYAMVNSDNGGFSFTPFMLERGNVATDWRPAPEDIDYTRDISELRTNIERTANGLREDVTRINQKFDNSGSLVELSRYKTEREATDRDITTKIAEYRQTVDGQIATVRGIANDSKALATSFRQEIDSINLSVSSLNSDTVKYADIDISDNGIRFGSRAEIDGNTLGSIISLSPDGIRAVADKMIISANNENLVSLDKRKLVISNSRDVIVSQWFSGGLRDGDEFLVQCQCLKKVAGAKQSFNILLYVDFQDGTARKFPMKQLQGELFDTMFSLGGGGVNSIPFIVNMTFKPTWDDSFNLKPVERWCIVLRQETQSNFCEWEVRNLAVYKKKSAELIVDGSIKAKHLDTNSVRTGILTANSITSTMLSSDVILAKHLKVDNAMIDKLLLNDLLVNKIIAKEALVNKIKATTIDASKITSGYITGDRIRGGIISGTIIEGVTIQGNSKIKIGEHGFLKPAHTGLHICSPETANARNGVGVQILGNTGRNNTSPYGVYIYKDPDFYSSRTESTTSYILTVGGYIKADGICNLKLTNYNDGSTGIRLWSGKRPELIFTDVENDIMYSWDGFKYPLWKIIQYHYSTASDKRIKRNITDSTLDALDLVEKLKFKEFDFIHNDLFEGKHVNNGLIAQELQELDDSLVYENNDILTIDSFKMLNIALKAIQELSEKINRLEKKLYAS